MTAPERRADVFQVPKGMDLFGGLITRWDRFWVRVGNLESSLLAEQIDAVTIERPVYVAGLARSGSTVLLEILSAVPGVVTHRYKDYPPIYTPYFWNWLLDRIPTREVRPVERTHLDGIMVMPDSPEAMEEILWMTFFPSLHDPGTSNVLGPCTANPPFERFYKDHIRKLLCVRGGQRYVSKGNYNVTRLEYLLKSFPDARFVIPVRRPDGHVASLMKQHTLFCEGETKNPRMLEHMRRIGHFEFGLDRRAINVGDDDLVKDITAMWNRGEEARAWGRYWASVYGYLADRLDASAALRQASMIVLFEHLCESAPDTIRVLLDHCELPQDAAVIADFSQRARFPTYYRPNLSEQDLRDIELETAETARRFGY